MNGSTPNLGHRLTSIKGSIVENKHDNHKRAIHLLRQFCRNQVELAPCCSEIITLMELVINYERFKDF